MQSNNGSVRICQDTKGTFLTILRYCCLSVIKIGLDSMLYETLKWPQIVPFCISSSIIMVCALLSLIYVIYIISVQKPAMEVVEDVILTVPEDQHFLLPKQRLLKRVANRFRAKTRLQEPKELNFEICFLSLHVVSSTIITLLR